MTSVLVLSVRLMLSKPWVKQSISCSQQQTKSLWWRSLSPLWHPSGVWGWTARLQSSIWPVFRSGGHGRNQSVWPRIYIVKSAGARKQPCFAPFVIRKASDSSLSSRNLTIMQSWNCWTIVMDLLRQPEFSIIFHKPSLLTVSKALVRSTKVTKWWLFCLWHFSWNGRAVNIMSAVPHSERKPHWFSGRSPCSKCWMKRFSRTRAKILPAKDWQLPFSVVDTGNAGIFELLWNLSFIPHRLEYLYHFLHHGCDTCFVHFSGDCVWSWHFARWELFDGLLDFSRWAAYQGADWTPLEVGGQWYHHWFEQGG